MTHGFSKLGWQRVYREDHQCSASQLSALVTRSEALRPAAKKHRSRSLNPPPKIVGTKRYQEKITISNRIRFAPPDVLIETQQQNVLLATRCNDIIFLSSQK